MLEDIVLVIATLGCFTLVGLPVCLLFPVDKFRFRVLAAAPIGLGLLSASALPLYVLDVPPAVTAIGASAFGIVACAALAIHYRKSWRLTGMVRNSTIGLAGGIVVVTLIGLAPNWVGGPRYAIFQGNVYDHFHVYLAGSVAYSQHPYSTLRAAMTPGQGNPVLSRAAWWVSNRGAISVVHAAVTQLGFGDAIAGNYAFRVALQINMLFAALFMFVNIFALSVGRSFWLASGLTLGFFEQYPFDINAGSHLAALPFELLVGVVAASSFEADQFGRTAEVAISRIAGVFCILLTGMIYIYPESLPIHAALVGAIVLAAICSSGLWSKSSRIGLAGMTLGAAGALLLVLPAWDITLGHAVRQAARFSVDEIDWWRYFHRYLLGGDANYLSPLVNPAETSWPDLIAAAFALPVDATMAAAGLYFLLPDTSWPRVLPTIWRLILYVFMIALICGVFGAACRLLRREWNSAASRFVCGALVACLIPVAILSAGFYWTAGKGLSLVAPMLFVVLALPLIEPRFASRMARAASFVFVAGHLALGLLRPMSAAQPSGAAFTGFPTSTNQVAAQKAAFEWDVRWLQGEVKHCRLVALDVDHMLAANFAALALTDFGTPWATRRPVHVGEGARPYRAELVDRADCLLTTNQFAPDPEKRVIWLSKDRSIIDFARGDLSQIEIGVEQHPGVVSTGIYGIEVMPNGALQWTAQTATFEIAKLSRPLSHLVLRFWPIGNIEKVRLEVQVNGATLFAGAPPMDPVTLPLAQFAGTEGIVIKLTTDVATHYPNDPRSLGVPLRELRLLK